MRAAAPLRQLTAVCIAVLALACAAVAAEPKFPALTGRVVDEAGILSGATRDRLTQMLAAHEQATGEQLVVVTLASLQGFPIEDFGYRLGRAWGIGQKDKNTGALLIVVPKERQVRIEVGYGLEERLTDALSRAIIERDLVPAFRRGDYDRGVIAGTAAILGALGGNPNAAAPAPAAAPKEQEDDPIAPLFLLFVIFMVIWGVLRHRHRGLWVGPTAGGTWSAGGSSSGSSSGSFSGGGGSFGGGGASGRW